MLLGRAAIELRFGRRRKSRRQDSRSKASFPRGAVSGRGCGVPWPGSGGFRKHRIPQSARCWTTASATGPSALWSPWTCLRGQSERALRSACSISKRSSCFGTGLRSSSMGGAWHENVMRTIWHRHGMVGNLAAMGRRFTERFSWRKLRERRNVIEPAARSAASAGSGPGASPTPGRSRSSFARSWCSCTTMASARRARCGYSSPHFPGELRRWTL